MEYLIANSTNNIGYVMAYNSLTGAKKTGLAYNTATLVASYKKDTSAASADFTLVDCTLGTYTSGGFKEVSATKHPGLYEFHIPDSILSTYNAFDKVVFSFNGIADVTFVPKAYKVVKEPAQQSTLLSITSGANAALNFAPVGTNQTAFTDAPANVASVAFVGTETSGTFANVTTINQTRHVVAAVNGIYDIIYQYKIGAGRNCGLVPFVGTVKVAAPIGTRNGEGLVYNFADNVWDSLWTVLGQTSVADVTKDMVMLADKHTGTGEYAGHVYVRFKSADAVSIHVDSLVAVAGNVGQTIGYSDGAIWVDEEAPAGRNTAQIHGTADVPCKWADAQILNETLKLNRFRIKNDSSVTLTASAADCSFIGDHWYLALEGQSINDSYIKGASVTGIGTATSHAILEDCELVDVTLPPVKLLRCGIGSNFAAGSSGQFFLVDCYSMVAGGGTPVFDFNTNISATTGISMRRWSGGTNVTLNVNCTATLEVLLGGSQTIVTNGGDVEVRGLFREVSIESAHDTLARVVGMSGNVNISGTGGSVEVYGVATSIADSSAGAVTIIDGRGVPSATDITEGFFNDNRYLFSQTSEYASLAGAIPDSASIVVNLDGPVTGSFRVKAYDSGTGVTTPLFTIDAENPTGLKDPEWLSNLSYRNVLYLSFTSSPEATIPSGTIRITASSTTLPAIDITVAIPEFLGESNASWFVNAVTGEYINWKGGATGYQAIPKLRPTAAQVLEAIQAEGTHLKAIQDRLPTNPAAVGSEMALTTAYDAAKVAYPSAAQVVEAVQAEGTYLKALVDRAVAPTTAQILAAIQDTGTYLKMLQDRIPLSPAAASDVPTTAQILTAIQNTGTFLRLIHDRLPLTPAAVGSAMTLTSAYDAAKTNITPAQVVDAMQAEGTLLKAINDRLPADPAAASDVGGGEVTVDLTPVLEFLDELTEEDVDGNLRFTSKALEKVNTPANPNELNPIRVEYPDMTVGMQWEITRKIDIPEVELNITTIRVHRSADPTAELWPTLTDIAVDQCEIDGDKLVVVWTSPYTGFFRLGFVNADGDEGLLSEYFSASNPLQDMNLSYSLNSDSAVVYKGEQKYLTIDCVDTRGVATVLPAARVSIVGPVADGVYPELINEAVAQVDGMSVKYLLDATVMVAGTYKIVAIVAAGFESLRSPPFKFKVKESI